MAAQYETITLGVNDLDRIELPKFQRGFVWGTKKKNDFVQTLHEGLPFGALLVYPKSQSADSKLILLDGQQRLSTIRQYRDNPLRFWKPLNYDTTYKEALDSINEKLGEEGALDEKKFDRLVSKKDDLADWADDASEDKATRKQLRDEIRKLQATVDKFVDLDSLGILAIKFIGSEDKIAEVFANLNKGGIPLSKYEIFSAAWVNTEITLLSSGESKEQDAILKNVKDYYNSMSDRAEFELSNFSEDDLSKSRKITLSEFGTALGTFVSDRLPALVSSSDSTRNEIGFGLLGIAAGVDNRQLSTLNTSINAIKKDLQLILEKTSRICSDLQSAFGKLLNRVMAGKDQEYVTGLSASFKTLSYFAALWNLDPESQEYRDSLTNIPTYYVYDFWARSWMSHGDQRLLDYYPKFAKRSYRQALKRENMLDAYSQWASDITAGINFSKEVKALVTIHSNLSYMSKVIPHGETFELEHIIAKKLINEAEDPSNKQIYGGALGNCMYLPKQINNKKKEKNLYEENADGRYTDLISESSYFTEDEFKEIKSSLEAHDYSNVNGFIIRRGEIIAGAISDQLLNQIV